MPRLLLSPFLFLFALDGVRKTTADGIRNDIHWTLWTQLDNLDFADDLALFAYIHRKMQDKTSTLSTISAQIGLEIHP
jgi:hypothetical protein